MIGGMLQPGSIVLDAPEYVPAIWGTGDQVLWSQGEPLILAGPPGVGKTSLAQQIALERACVAFRGEVLGFPVEADQNHRTLYVAADRPKQSLRSMRRMVTPDDRDLLDSGLLIWSGPFDVFGDADSLVELLDVEGIGTLILDSIKDVAGDISDGKVGAAFNATMQTLVADGIEVMALHHNRKAQDGNRKPQRLDDLYGSRWVGAGAGSVVNLWGEAGDPVVELRHLKQPYAEVGPLTVLHDHKAGVSTVDVKAARENADKREKFRAACIECLQSGSPLGRNALIKQVRDQGISGKSDTFRRWLTELAADPASGLDKTDDGYALTHDPEQRGHGGVTPAETPMNP